MTIDSSSAVPYHSSCKKAASTWAVHFFGRLRYFVKCDCVIRHLPSYHGSLDLQRFKLPMTRDRKLAVESNGKTIAVCRQSSLIEVASAIVGFNRATNGVRPSCLYRSRIVTPLKIAAAWSRHVKLGKDTTRSFWFEVRDLQPGLQMFPYVCTIQFLDQLWCSAFPARTTRARKDVGTLWWGSLMAEGSGMRGMRAAKSFLTSGTFHSKQTATSKIIESLGMSRYDLKSSSGFPAFSSCVTGRCMLKLPSPVHGEPRGCKYGLAQCGSCLSHLF